VANERINIQALDREVRSRGVNGIQAAGKIMLMCCEPPDPVLSILCHPPEGPWNYRTTGQNFDAARRLLGEVQRFWLFNTVIT
jgi:hypothetical protein